jgi:hypothetical protein
MRLVQRSVLGLYFLQTVKKLDVLTSTWIVGVALLIAAPALILWGWFSDKDRSQANHPGWHGPRLAHVLPSPLDAG